MNPETTDQTTGETTEQATGELTEHTLIEEVSIDGMCGVY